MATATLTQYSAIVASARKLSLPDMMEADLLQQIIEHATDFIIITKREKKR